MLGVGARPPRWKWCVGKWCGRDEAVSVVVDDVTGSGTPRPWELYGERAVSDRSGVIGRYVEKQIVTGILVYTVTSDDSSRGKRFEKRKETSSRKQVGKQSRPDQISPLRGFRIAESCRVWGKALGM